MHTRIAGKRCCEDFRESIDMAVFGSVPQFARVSVLFRGLDTTVAVPASGFTTHARRTVRSDKRVRTGCDAAWGEAYASVGLDEGTVPPHESLAAWAATATGVPSQGALADLVNGFSLELAVPAAAYDAASIEGDVWLCPCRGVELFLPVDDDLSETPAVHELILVDGSARVMARRWHGAQGRPFVVGRATETALVHVDLLPPAVDSAEGITAGLVDLVTGSLGGQGDAVLLNRSVAATSWRR